MTLRELRRHLAAPYVRDGIARAGIVVASADKSGRQIVIWEEAGPAFTIVIPNSEQGLAMASLLVAEIKATHPDARGREVAFAA